MENDPDDNKLVDCAISAGVRYIVTNDKHFDILRRVQFPTVEVVSALEFLDELDVGR